MTAKGLDNIYKRMLNDRKLLRFPQDNRTKKALCIFNSQEWEKLRAAAKADRLGMIEERLELISSRKKEVKDNKWLKERLDTQEKMLKALRQAQSTKSYLLDRIFGLMDDYGELESVLRSSTLETIGALIERHEFPVIETQILSACSRRGGQETIALHRLLEYLKELWELQKEGLSRAEVAFLIRKIASLPNFMEVLQNE